MKREHIFRALVRVCERFTEEEEFEGDIPDAFWQKARQVKLVKQALEDTLKWLDKEYSIELGIRSRWQYPKWMTNDKRIMKNLKGTRFNEIIDYIISNTVSLPKAIELYKEEDLVLFQPNYDRMARKLKISQDQAKRYIYSLYQVVDLKGQGRSSKRVRGVIAYPYEMTGRKRDGGLMTYSVGYWNKTPKRRIFYLKNNKEMREFLRCWKLKKHHNS